MAQSLPLGKLPASMLEQFLGSLPRDADLVVPPATGEDAAVIDVEPEALLVAAADPVTFPTARPGWYAVHLNANDVATRGGTPRWFLATVLLPAGTDSLVAQQLLSDIASTCTALGITLVGGHTEVSASVRWPLVSGCMLGTVAAAGLRRTSSGQVGDTLVLTGSVGAAGTSRLACEAAPQLRHAGWTDVALGQAANLVDRVGISVLAAAIAAAPYAHALHDLTEGGLATAVLELAVASQVGAVLHPAWLQLAAPETLSICASLHLDLMGLLSSGCLLIAVPPGLVDACLRALGDAHVPAVACGTLVERAHGCTLVDGDRVMPLPRFARDELARWLDDHHDPSPGSADILAV